MYKFLYAILIVCVVQACSSESEPESGQVVQKETASWIHPECTAAALKPSGNNQQMCNGPWLYSYQEWWKDRAACGDTTTCKVRRACTSWDLNTAGDGLGFTVASWTESAEGAQSCPGTGPCMEDPPHIACQTMATNRRGQLLTTRPGISGPALAGFTVSSHSTILRFDMDIEPPFATVTTYACDIVISNFPSAMTTPRPACPCAELEPKECPRGGEVTVFTAPGAVRPSNAGAPSPGSTRRDLVATPQCTTCDQLAIDNSANAQAKFTCLDQTLDNVRGITGAGPQADVISSVAARMGLTLQLAGEHLTADQVTRSQEIYNEEPAARTICRTPITWNPSCLPAADTQLLTHQLQLCNDLATNPNASQGAATVVLDHCFSQLEALADLDDACKTAMRDTADTTVQTVLQKAQPNFGGDFSVALPLALSRIGTWWSLAISLAGSDHLWFTGRSSALARWLWSAIEAQRMPLPQTPPANDTQAAELLADIADTRLENDVSVLSFAFAPGQTQSAPPLLTLTGDALKALSDRLVRLQPIHDVGCRFKPCKVGTTLESSALSELTRALATLPDAGAFAAALAAATHLQQQQPGIYLALTKVRDQHVYLRTAWNLLGRPEPFANLATIPVPPPEATGLAALVRTAVSASSSYQASGEFVPWNPPRLSTATLRQADLVGFVNGLIGNVNGELTDYADSRLDTVRDLLEQSRSGAATQSHIDQLAALADRALEIAGRADALGLREGSERAGLSKYHAQFEALANSGVLDPNLAYQTQILSTLSASAADRHFLPNTPRNIARDRFAMVPLRVGQSLRIRVIGEWAPTCSISHTSIIDPNIGSELPLVIDQALTGPEGYYATADENKYHVLSYSETDGISVSTSSSSCHSSNTGSSCGGLSVSAQTPATTDTLGAESRIAANFTFGLRAPTTPYPNAPAGSLLAVITRKGVTGATSDPPDIDVRVVRRDDVIVAPTPPPSSWPQPEELEVHFVVNDMAIAPNGGPCPMNTSALQIEMSRTTPFGNVSQLIGAAIGDTLAEIADKAPAVIAQGNLSAAEQTALRAEAWARLGQALQPSGIGVTGLPQELRQLFEAFLERELASIARRGQRNALHQELAQLGFQRDGINAQRLFTDAQNRLLHLIPRWRLRDLAGIHLAESTNALSEALTTYAAPVFELRDPVAHSNFRAQVVSQANRLIGIDITAPYEEPVDDLLAFARAVSNAVGAAQFQVPMSQRRTIIIALARPPEPGRTAWTGPWQKASNTTANAFWNSVFDQQGNLSANATVSLSPADIYSGPGGASRLACRDIAPVVRHVGLYFATDNQPVVLGPAGVEIVGTAAVTDQVWFPLVGRTVSFEPDDPLGIPIRMRALNGDTVSVLGDGAGSSNFGAWPAELGAGAGISPFTSFSFDMRGFGPSASQDIEEVLNKTNALFVVFEVERRTSNLDASIPGVCD
jgi:hypothetical protein